MAKDFEIDWKGLKTFTNHTRVLPKSITKEADAVTKNIGEKGRMTAKKYAPVDTWFMHDNIFTFHSKLHAEVQSTATYSGYVNYGTRRQSAQPFFSDMVDEMSKLYREQLGEVLEGELSL